MKKRKFILIPCLLGIAAALSLADENLVTPAPEGAEESGPAPRISLVSLTPEQPGLFRVDLENTGDKDLMLNLGMMLANGKVMMPEDVHLILVDARGESKELLFTDRRHHVVAGRVDDFVVPLRAGSAYSLRLSLNDYWCPQTKEFEIALQPGEYRIHAVLNATGARHVNLDTEGMKLMNYWTGSLCSAPVVVKVRK